MADPGTESLGAVCRRRKVVDLILDFAGYMAEKQLHRARLLEPSMAQERLYTTATLMASPRSAAATGEFGEL